MTIAQFIQKFISAAGLKQSVEEIFFQTLQKAIDLIYTDDDPNNDYYAEALRLCKNQTDLIELISENREYNDIFLSALIVLLDELTTDAQWTSAQKYDIQKLLDFYESKLKP